MPGPARYPKKKAPTGLELAGQAIEHLKRQALRECFAAANLQSRPTAAQLDILRGINDYLIRFVTAGNQSGKTDTAVRELVWLIEGTHPFFAWPREWGEPGSPLLCLVVGQDRLQLDVNIWQTRIKPFLNADDWKENRSGSALQSVTHRTKGHQIVFLSHNNSSEQDIKHMQSYSAHWVWCDEMPSSIRVLEELQRRVDAKRGRFICTFTQKVRNDAIRKLVDASDGVVSKKYQLNKLDNPIYKGREEEELAKLAALPPELRAAILTGAWLTSETHVYQIIPDLHCGKPDGYNPSWRHLAVVDPATESKLGLTVWAESPVSGLWWCVVSRYIEQIFVPTKIVEAVERILHPLNVVKRVYDTEASWFKNQAREMGFVYLPVPNKSGRKPELIANFQEALGSKIRIADWCVELLAELESCERSETNPDKIANSSKYHLIDTAHYAVDRLPPPEPTRVFSTRADYLIQLDDARQAREQQAAKRRAEKLVRQYRVRRPTQRARLPWTL